MADSELEALGLRLDRAEVANRRIADIVRRALYQIIRVIETEFDLPPIIKTK